MTALPAGFEIPGSARAFTGAASFPGDPAWPRPPRVEGYLLRRLLGRGRRSRVYLATDLLRGMPVALKLAEHARPHSCGPARRFSREAAIGASIRHPNVMRVFDDGISDDLAYLSMEHAEGGDLRERIRQGMSPGEAVALLRQAARALAELHRRGWVHRDIKPANFLLRSSGQLLLADFGLACEAGCACVSSPGAVVGTPRYASPEQSQGGVAEPAADVYSLGVVFYEMLCGTPPFPGETLTEVFCQHLMAPVPKLAPQLCGLQPLVDSMLAKDAGSRFRDGGVLLEEMERNAGAFLLPPQSAGPNQDGCLP